MLKTDGQYRLVFCTHTGIRFADLVEGLHDIAFIGKPVFASTIDKQTENAADTLVASGAGNALEYCVGESFLSSVTFMGCSPFIEFEPPEQLQPQDAANFCFIRVGTTGRANIAYHEQQFELLKSVPRCRHCRKIIPDWPSKVAGLNESSSNELLSCPNCDAVLTRTDLDWRKASGVGNVFVEILNVYLQEAVPTDSFLQQLETITSSTWQYFYTDSNIKTMLLDSI